MPRYFFVRTFGCQMNEHDSERIAADLASEGLVRTDDQDLADVIVLNTCCIRENADTKLYGHLGHLKSLKARRPEVQIAVGGCLAQSARDALIARAPHIDAVFGTHNVGRASSLLRTARSEARSVVEVLDAPDEDPFPSALAVRPELTHAAWVTVQVGCDNSCAFCIVPSVRGPEQSRPFAAIVDEVADLARAGTTEVTLLGQNVNSYGRDLALAHRASAADVATYDCGGSYAAAPQRRARPLFADLLVALGGVRGIRRIRFTSPHPKDLRPETIAAMATTPAVCEHLHLPLQSGSDRVLRAMHRGYDAARYLDRLERARRAVDDLAVTTDVIVGFPGETDDDFAATLELVAAAEFDSAFTFLFSPRPGTEAAAMVDEFVPDDVAHERFERLKAVVDRSALRRHEARIGRVEEVVVEGVSRRRASELAARTRQGKLVHFRSPERLDPGRYATVEVRGAGAHHLTGELLSVEDEPVRRRRIPLRLTSG